MNARNPKGPRGVKSPGRRALSTDLSGVSVGLPEYVRRDPELRRVSGRASAAWAKFSTAPQGTSSLRRDELYKNAMEAFDVVRDRIVVLVRAHEGGA